MYSSWYLALHVISCMLYSAAAEFKLVHVSYAVSAISRAMICWNHIIVCHFSIKCTFGLVIVAFYVVLSTPRKF